MGFEKCSTVVLNNKVEKYKLWFIRTIRNLNSLTTHAGFLLCFVYVPFVICASSDALRRLSYEEIYNNTDYAPIQGRPEKPYNLNYRFNNFKDTKDNNIEEYRLRDKFDVSNKSQLLVGFAHDPFRLSIPEEDYLNGVREIDPKQYSNKGDRSKRDVVNLYNMLTCSTGCDPLSYMGYGCYCGYLGSGKPVDGIDKCCKLHDECYGNINCPSYTLYIQPYYWKCRRGKPLCANEKYKKDYLFTNKCARKLCECDRRFAMCVKRYSCPRRRRRPLCKSSPLGLVQNLLFTMMTLEGKKHVKQFDLIQLQLV